MSIVTSRPPEVDAPCDPEAGVIEEARRRRARRRVSLAVACLGLGVLAAVVLAVVSRGSAGDARMLRFGRSGPSIDARVFAGQGDLAFVSRGTLWVLDGRGGLRRMPTTRGLAPTEPQFSVDGRWLAYLAAGDGNALWHGRSVLWIARADGSGAHAVAWLTDPTIIGWSPHGDALAVTDTSLVSRALRHGYVRRATSVWLLKPSGAGRRLMSAAEIDGGSWAPNATAVAVAIDSVPPLVGRSAWIASIVSYPVDGGVPTAWLRLPSRSGLSAPSPAPGGRDQRQTVLLPVGWWLGWGIGFWTDSAAGTDPSVRDGGGLDLWHVSAPGRTPALIGNTLSDRALAPIVASATGELAFADEPGRTGAEPLWQNEQVLRCSPATQACADVAQPRGTVSIDPEWAPDGSALAYLVGPRLRDQGDGGFAQRAVAGWYDSLQLWLYRPATGRTDLVPAARGAVAPVWSTRGHSLLYVSHDGLWLWKGLHGAPVEIAGPLLPLDDWSAFFAQIDWSDRFAWSR